MGSLACWMLAVAPGFIPELYPGGKVGEKVSTLQLHSGVRLANVHRLRGSSSLHNVHIQPVLLICSDLAPATVLNLVPREAHVKTV